MPYKQVWCDPEIVLQHNGVTIYRSYKYGEFENPFTYHFCLEPGQEGVEPDDFDVRNLPVPSVKPLAGSFSSGAAMEDCILQALREAIDAGLLGNPA